jgi:hypothetical protein
MRLPAIQMLSLRPRIRFSVSFVLERSLTGKTAVLSSEHTGKRLA